MAACLGNELAMVKFLCEQGRALMTLSYLSGPPCGWFKCATKVHEERGGDPNIVNSKGQTMLAAACHDNRLRMCVKLCNPCDLRDIYSAIPISCDSASSPDRGLSRVACCYPYRYDLRFHKNCLSNRFNKTVHWRRCTC
jgi:hypothetical protein